MNRATNGILLPSGWGPSGKKFLAEAISFLVYDHQQELGLEWEGPCAHLSSSAELHSVHGMGKSCSHSDLLPHLQSLSDTSSTQPRSPKVEVQNKSKC